MGIGTILVIFTLLALLGVLIVSERVRYNMCKHWLDPSSSDKDSGPHH